MRHLLGISLAVALVVGIAAAATTPDTAAATPTDPTATGAATPANAPAARPVPRRMAQKTVGQPKPSSPVDPAAGTSEQGTPNPTVTNGSQLAH